MPMSMNFITALQSNPKLDKQSAEGSDDFDTYQDKEQISMAPPIKKRPFVFDKNKI